MDGLLMGKMKSSAGKPAMVKQVGKTMKDMPAKPMKPSGKPTKAKVVKTMVNMLATNAPAPGSSVIPGKRGKKANPSSAAKPSTMKMKKPKVGAMASLINQTNS
jgi:hypothetical protein